MVSNVSVLVLLKRQNLTIQSHMPFLDQKDSFILAPFSHDGSHEKEIAGALAFAPDGKELLYATRLIGVDMVHSIEIYPKNPGKRWGGFESRVDFLNNSLNSYFS